MKNMIPVIISVAAAAGVGYVCGKYREQISREVKKVANKIKNGIHEQEINLQESVEQQLEQIVEKPFEFNIETAKTEFLQVADKFIGIYESLFVETTNKTGSYSIDGLDDWNTRIKYLDKKPHFQTFWNENKKDLQKIIDFFYACGVVRDSQKEIIATEQTRYLYKVISGEKIEIGKKYIVVMPCWTLQDKVLEKGMLKSDEE